MSNHSDILSDFQLRTGICAVDLTLFLKKNITVHGSYSSYMVLKSGHSEISTRYMTAQPHPKLAPELVAVLSMHSKVRAFRLVC
jgi:hypothetical protein